MSFKVHVGHTLSDHMTLGILSNVPVRGISPPGHQGSLWESVGAGGAQKARRPLQHMKKFMACWHEIILTYTYAMSYEYLWIVQVLSELTLSLDTHSRV